GGLDSRLSLAASRKFKDRINYFTYSIRGNRYLKSDMKIAGLMSESLGLRHSQIVVTSNDLVSEEIIAQLELNAPGNLANADLTQAYYDHFGCRENRVHVRSNLMEICRGYYLSNKANLLNAYTPRKISGLFRGS